MRNVFKGFQMGKTAVPKLHMDKVNSDFTKMHAPSLKRPAIRIETPKAAKKAPRMPGKNPGTRL